MSSPLSDEEARGLAASVDAWTDEIAVLRAEAGMDDPWVEPRRLDVDDDDRNERETSEDDHIMFG